MPKSLLLRDPGQLPNILYQPSWLLFQGFNDIALTAYEYTVVQNISISIPSLLLGRSRT